MKDVSKTYDEILKQALEIPGARVSRVDFLKKNLRFWCLPEQIEIAIASSVKKAGISGEVLEGIAKSIIKEHTLKVTGVSTLTGMPGGVVMAATIPADLTHYYYHVIVLAQKLAYLYGYSQFEGDEELGTHLTLFIGVMYEVDGADEAVYAFSKNPAAETLGKVPGKTLSETTSYLIKKNIARWVGLKVTRRTFPQSFKKVIPVVSGIISGGISYITFTPMAQNLKDTLEKAHIGG